MCSILSVGDAFQGVERKNVAGRPEAADDALAGGSDQRPVPEFLACMHVGDMDLDDRNGDGAYSDVERDRRVGIGARIEGDAEGLFARLVQTGDEIALVLEIGGAAVR